MPSAVSVKGKTNEGVESMGRSESMACHAVALLRGLKVRKCLKVVKTQCLGSAVPHDTVRPTHIDFSFQES